MKSKKSKYPDSFNHAPLDKKAAMIFEWMGYKVDWNRCFQSYQVDLFFMKKEDLCDDFEYWLCIIDTGESKLAKDVVTNLVQARTIAREELKQNKYHDVDCQGMIITENGFSKEAMSEAGLHKIELMTLARLIGEFEFFKKRIRKIIRDIDELLTRINAKKKDRQRIHFTEYKLMNKEIIQRHRDEKSGEKVIYKKSTVKMID